MSSKLSYACGMLREPYLYDTIPDRLTLLAKENPTRDALVFYNEEMERLAISRQELYERSTSLAKVLLNLGLKKGQTVGFCMNNSLEMLISIMAVITAGGIPFFMATNLRDGSDIVETMNDMEASLLFIDTNQDDDNWKIIQNFTPSEQQQPLKTRSLKAVVCNGIAGHFSGTILSLSSLMKEINQEVTLPRVLPEDIAVYFCTSGSTGKPKAVGYTHFNLLNFTRHSNSCVHLGPASVYFCDRSFGWGVGFPRVYLADGTVRVFIDTKLSLSGAHIEGLCDIIKKEKCDVVYLPGYLSVDLMKNSHLAERFTAVNVVILSGERFPKSSVTLKGKFCKHLYAAYGSTEAGVCSVFCSENLDSYEDGIIGTPIPGMEFKVVDETGDTVEIDTPGELLVRSVFRFVEYKSMPEKFPEVVDRANWFHTGDRVRMREDRNCVVEGRLKEMISMQTMKYFPWDVETVVKKCPRVKSVIAVGVPDERLTQVICACVVPEDGVSLTEDDVIKFCDETYVDKGTASRLTLKPKYVIVLDKLPLTTSGKTDRLKVTEIAKRKLGI